MIYTYRCKNKTCAVIEDRLVTSKTAEQQFCKVCGSKEAMEQLPSYPTAIRFKGTWFKNKGHY